MFKQATVNAASIPSTQTNFPVYVDLSRVGITTLAQAQSSRWYEDSAKIVEVPREIASAAEGWGKYSSLTSTSQLFIDWDAIRADYAVTDTYGAQAVWSDYTTVLHSVGVTDSTGNHAGYTANGGVTVGGVSGQIGTATDFDGSNDYIGSATDTAMDGDTAQSVQMWIKPDVINTRMGIAGKTIGVNIATSSWLIENQGTPNGSMRYLNYYGTSTANFLDTPANALVNGVWNAFSFTRNGANSRIYKNGASIASSSAWSTAANNNLTGDFGIGRFGAGNFLYFNGQIDEFRYRKAQLSADWYLTEYNNQNDEATFWGTWTDVAGGSSAAAARRLLFFGL